MELLQVPISFGENPILDLVGEVNRVQERRSGSILDLVDIAPCTGITEVILEVLFTLLAPAFLIGGIHGPNIFYAVCAIGARLTIENGPSVVSAAIVGCYTSVLLAFGNLRSSLSFHDPSAPLNNHFRII